MPGKKSREDKKDEQKKRTRGEPTDSAMPTGYHGRWPFRIEQHKKNIHLAVCNGVLFWGLMRKIIPGNSATVLHREEEKKNPTEKNEKYQKRERQKNLHLHGEVLFFEHTHTPNIIRVRTNRACPVEYSYET